MAWKLCRVIYGGGTPCTYQNSTTIKGLSGLNPEWSGSRSCRASLAMYDRRLSTKGERITLILWFHKEALRSFINHGLAYKRLLISYLAAPTISRTHKNHSRSKWCTLIDSKYVRFLHSPLQLPARHTQHPCSHTPPPNIELVDDLDLPPAPRHRYPQCDRHTMPSWYADFIPHWIQDVFLEGGGYVDLWYLSDWCNRQSHGCIRPCIHLKVAVALVIT